MGLNTQRSSPIAVAAQQLYSLFPSVDQPEVPVKQLEKREVSFQCVPEQKSRSNHQDLNRNWSCQVLAPTSPRDLQELDEILDVQDASKESAVADPGIFLQSSELVAEPAIWGTGTILAAEQCRPAAVCAPPVPPEPRSPLAWQRETWEAGITHSIPEAPRRPPQPEAIVTEQASSSSLSPSPQRTGLLPMSPAQSGNNMSRTALLLLPEPASEEQVPLSTGPPEKTFKRVRAIIHHAGGFRGADAPKLNDPYCVLEVRGREQTLHKRVRAKVIDQGLYPIWNEKFDFDYELGAEINLSIWDKGIDKPDEFLGMAKVTHDMFLPAGFDGHVPLEDRAALWEADARMHVKIRALP
jgi:hypothetical protein